MLQRVCSSCEASTFLQPLVAACGLARPGRMKLNKESQIAHDLIYNGEGYEPQPCDLALGESCGCGSSANNAIDCLNPG